MATTYYEDVTASDLSEGGSFTHLLTQTQPGAKSSDPIQPAASSSLSGYYATPASDPSSGTSTGTFTVQVNVTSTFSTTSGQCQLHRANSAGTIQASSGYFGSQALSSAGVHTFSTTNPALGTWAAGDRLVVEVRVTNGSTHAGRGCTFETGGTSDTVVAPWSASITNNDSGSGTITLSSSTSEASSCSVSATGTIALSGSRTEGYANTVSVSGAISLSGSGIDLFGQGFSDSGSGILSLSGSSTAGWNNSTSPSGAITISGSGSSQHSVSDSGSGTISLSGSSIEFHGISFLDSASGSLTIGGSRVDALTWTATNQSGSLTLSGSGVESYSSSASPSYSPFLLMHHTGLSRKENIEQWLKYNTSYPGWESMNRPMLDAIEHHLLSSPCEDHGQAIQFHPYYEAGTDRLWAIEEYLLAVTNSSG